MIDGAPNHRFQPTYLPPLRYGKSAAEAGRLVIMDAREIYAVLFDPRGPAGAPKGEWRFVGDTSCFDAARFDELASIIKSPVVVVAVSRTDAREVPRIELAAAVLAMLESGEVRVADQALRAFVQIATAGVARSWVSNA